jgi:hypothetical protein
METTWISVDGKAYQVVASIERTVEAIYVRLDVQLEGATVAACKLRCWRYEPGYDSIARMPDADLLQLAMRVGAGQENVRAYLAFQAGAASVVSPMRMALLPENYQPENLGWAR